MATVGVVFGRLSRSLFGKRLGVAVVGLVVSVAVLVGLSGVASADSGDGSLSVGTGYAHEGVEDLIWAADHMVTKALRICKRPVCW